MFRRFEKIFTAPFSSIQAHTVLGSFPFSIPSRLRRRNSALAQYSHTPARNASRSDAGGPSLRVTGFEDSGSTELAEVLPDVASRLARHSFPACPT